MVKDYPFYSDNPIDSPERVVELMQEKMADLDREHLYLINLTTKGRPINVNLISVGSLNGSVVHMREVFKSSILSNAAAFILVHNHPSGDCTPSKEDVVVTDRILQCSELLGIGLLDHIIIGGEGKYFSFKQHEMIETQRKALETDYRKIDKDRFWICA